MLIAACGRIGFDTSSTEDSRGDDGVSGDRVSDADQLETGLVAWFRFDEGSGAIVGDSSATGDNGLVTACGIPTWVAGKIGGALDFSAAATNCVVVDEVPALDIAGTWTVATWVKLDSMPAMGSSYTLVSKANSASQHNYGLFVDNGTFAGGGAGFVVTFHDQFANEYNAKLPNVPASGLWYHVAGTWDGTTLLLYVNGGALAMLVPTGVPAASAFIDPTTILLAADQCCGRNLDGALDDVRIYNRALTAIEIATLAAQ